MNYFFGNCHNNTCNYWLLSPFAIGSIITFYKGLIKKQAFQINRNSLYKRRETLEEQKKVFMEQNLGDDLIVKKLLEQFDLDIKEGIAEEDDK